MIKAISTMFLTVALAVFLSGSGMAQTTKPEHPTKTEQPKTEEKKADHPKVEQKKAEEKKAEPPKAEEKKPEHPK